MTETLKLIEDDWVDKNKTLLRTAYETYILNMNTGWK